MATKLKFPRTSARSFKLTWLRPDGDPESLAGASFAAFIKASVFDADADALVDLSAGVLVLDASAGEAVLTFDPADLLSLDPVLAMAWQARATLADGRVLELDAHRGPLVFDPYVGPADIAEPDNDYVAAYSIGTAGTGSGSATITGLIGGTSSDLDGLGAAYLATIQNGHVLELFFTGSIAARFRIRAKGSDTESSPFLVVADNDTTRAWELVSVHKEGVPCVWNPDTSKWHQQLASGTGGAISGSIADEADAFSLPS